MVGGSILVQVLLVVSFFGVRALAGHGGEGSCVWRCCGVGDGGSTRRDAGWKFGESGERVPWSNSFNRQARDAMSRPTGTFGHHPTSVRTSLHMPHYTIPTAGTPCHRPNRGHDTTTPPTAGSLGPPSAHTGNGDPVPSAPHGILRKRGTYTKFSLRKMIFHTTYMFL